MGFEPTRAEHIGLAVQRLNHSATSSSWRRLSPPCQSTTLKSHRVHGQNVPTPGVEPGPSGWKPDILAVRPRGNNIFSPGIESGTFCLLNRCNNHYTTKTPCRGGKKCSNFCLPFWHSSLKGWICTTGRLIFYSTLKIQVWGKLIRYNDRHAIARQTRCNIYVQKEKGWINKLLIT